MGSSASLFLRGGGETLTSSRCATRVMPVKESTILKRSHVAAGHDRWPNKTCSTWMCASDRRWGEKREKDSM